MKHKIISLLFMVEVTTAQSWLPFGGLQGIFGTVNQGFQGFNQAAAPYRPIQSNFLQAPAPQAPHAPPPTATAKPAPAYYLVNPAPLPIKENLDSELEPPRPYPRRLPQPPPPQQLQRQLPRQYYPPPQAPPLVVHPRMPHVPAAVTARPSSGVVVVVHTPPPQSNREFQRSLSASRMIAEVLARKIDPKVTAMHQSEDEFATAYQKTRESVVDLSTHNKKDLQRSEDDFLRAYAQVMNSTGNSPALQKKTAAAGLAQVIRKAQHGKLDKEDADAARAFAAILSNAVKDPRKLKQFGLVDERMTAKHVLQTALRNRGLRFRRRRRGRGRRGRGRRYRKNWHKHLARRRTTSKPPQHEVINDENPVKIYPKIKHEAKVPSPIRKQHQKQKPKEPRNILAN